MTFRVQKTYTFDTLAPAILGATFKNATLLGEVSYDLASTSENIALKYRQIYPALPQGTSDDPKTQRYFTFRTESKALVTLCEQWIDMDTVVEVLGVNFNVAFTGASPEDKNNVRDILLAAGYNNFKIA